MVGHRVQPLPRIEKRVTCRLVLPSFRLHAACISDKDIRASHEKPKGSDAHDASRQSHSAIKVRMLPSADG